MTLLVGAVVLVVHDSRADRGNELRQDVRIEAATEAARLDEYFDRSAALVRQLAQNPAFREFYDDPRPFATKVADPAISVGASQALAFLEELYPGTISEACFIDAGGSEVARAVEGRIAQLDELSPDETAAPFFAPAFGLGEGEVYQSAPYRSPDTGVYVIANATPIPDVNGTRPAIVHFEVKLDSFRADETSRARVRIIDSVGSVLVDSAVAQDVEGDLGHPEDTTFVELARAGGLAAVAKSDSQVASIGGEVVALQPIETGHVSPNEWYLAASMPADVGLVGGISRWTLLSFLVGGIVLAMGYLVLRHNERRLRVFATTDALTGLPNRRLFADRVSQAIQLCARENAQAAVLLLDMNRFKEVNDTLGHHRGDQLLKEMAGRMRRQLRGSDTIARLGGDEFAVVLTKTDGVFGAVETCERLLQALGEETSIEGIPFRADASIGIALYPDHGHTVDDLLQHADVAMYKAKRGGSDYAVYTFEDDPHSAERLALIAQLRAGLEANELFLHYQPKYDLSTMEMIGVEALIRWDHPTRGMVPPLEFISLAEVSGLLRPLTNFVMSTAFLQASAWRRAGHELTVAVNVSPRSLADSTFIDDLESALAAAEAEPGWVVIEITEDALFDEPAISRAALSTLRDRGFAVSIDDFGTGYSSLSYLRELPVNEVKIDRSFIMQLAEAGPDRAIVESTIALAHSLGYRVVAEGIETEFAFADLQRMGCDLAQGFLLARPTTADAVTAMLPAVACTSASH